MTAAWGMEELRGVHVRVIDDDQLARHFIRSILEFAGAIVTAAGSADALRAALIADIIVCDLISQLQQLHVRLGRVVPTIALVAAGTRRVRVQAAGFEIYLTKPVDGDELRAAVVERLRQ
jgi:CheY-like chemotaxis protein